MASRRASSGENSGTSCSICLAIVSMDSVGTGGCRPKSVACVALIERFIHNSTVAATAAANCQRDRERSVRNRVRRSSSTRCRKFAEAAGSKRLLKLVFKLLQVGR